MTRPEQWLAVAGEVLGLSVDELAGRYAAGSFLALGGSSLGAIELLSLGQRRLAATVDAARLLGPEPLARVLLDAVPHRETSPAPDTRPDRELLPGQRPMLAAHLAGADRPYHLMFTLECGRRLDPDRVARALAELVAGNSSLRTMFVADGPNQARRVLPPTVRPRLVHQHLSGPDPVHAVHQLYGPASAELLRPFERPPVVFVLSRAGDGDLLTMVVHHVLVDGWSIGVLWRQFVTLYEGGAASFTQQPDQIAAQDGQEAATGRVAARVEGAPTVVVLPTDRRRPAQFDGLGARLVFELDAESARAVEALAARCQVTVTTVVLAAWALVIARRTGQDDLLIGMPASGRFGADMMDIVGLCTRVVPVRCRIDDGIGVEEHVRGVGNAVAAAVADAGVPFEQLVSALGGDVDPARNPLTQLGFAAHHELVPDTIGSWRLHEGHCGGAVFDAILYLQRWSRRPRLALEYATSALSAGEAGELADSLAATLAELDSGAELATVRTMSAAQRARVERLGTGATVDHSGDVWQAFERHALCTPETPAVSDTQAGITLTYGQLRLLALDHAARLAAAGVTAGDRVLLELPRSAAEAVAVLAVLRLGAGYVAMDPQATEQWRDHVLATARPAARIGPADIRFDRPTKEPELADAPRHIAYVAYTSGSTGLPKGVAVPHRAVLRLAADPDVLAAAPHMRMLRLAPLAFDASTLELLVTLTRGATVEVYPPGDADPAALAEFLRRTGVTHAWLTSGLFQIVAEHRPDAFRGLRQLLTGGGVVSARHVRRVLEHCAGLRITNGYGPTENTVFTTTCHVDGAHQVGDDLPIGTPLAGTGVAVLDRHGRLAPPGGVGELWTTGAGLAEGYLGEPDRTAAVFTEPIALGERAYRTGDLVRWDADGALRFLGRADRQVKIAGHRVELADVERRIAGRPGVLDALVFLAEGGRLCAAVRTTADLAAIRAEAEAELPAYARPRRWIVVTEFPLTGNGKVDTRALAAVEPSPLPAPVAPTPDLEGVVTQAWVTVLGTDDFDDDEPFFEVGGDSLRLAQVRNLLRERLPGHPVALVDLYRFPTVRSLARHLAGAAG